jgi:hypothetical protein
MTSDSGARVRRRAGPGELAHPAQRAPRGPRHTPHPRLHPAPRRQGRPSNMATFHRFALKIRVTVRLFVEILSWKLFYSP